MTASLIIVLLCQTALFLAAFRHSSGRRKEARFWLTIAALVLLPLCFGPIAAISHIVFEVTPERLFWVFLALAGGLLAVTLKYLYARAGTDLPRRISVGLCLATIFNVLVLLAGMKMHGHESGPTPLLIDSPYFVLTWLASALAVGSIIWAIFWQAGPQSFGRFVLVPMLLAAWFIELASSV